MDALVADAAATLRLPPLPPPSGAAAAAPRGTHNALLPLPAKVRGATADPGPPHHLCFAARVRLTR